MSGSCNIKDVSDGVMISFGEKFAGSAQFGALFKEGMALVERTAGYLDGDGRKEARALAAPVAVVYATESMRLTTRLLELASWLLIRRALKDGEITLEEARVKRRRLRLTAIGRPSHVKKFAELPECLRALIEESFSLHDQILRVDRALEGKFASQTAALSENPVEMQLARLSAAFTQ